MDESSRDASHSEPWREAFSLTIDQQRRRVAERIATQRERLRELESRLSSQLDEAAAALSGQHEAADRSTAEMAARRDELNRLRSELDQRKTELAQEASRLAAEQQALARKQAELDQLQSGILGASAANQERAAELDRYEAELAEARQQHAAEAHKLQTKWDELRRLEAEIQAQSQAVHERQQQTQRQRRQLAQQFKAKRKELAAERELLQASGAGQDLQLQLRLSELQGKYDRLREELERLQLERDESAHRIAELKGQLETRQREMRDQQAAAEQALRRQQELEQERNRLQADLQRNLEEARRQAEAARADLAERSSEVQKQAAEIARLATELDRVRSKAHEQIERLRVDQNGTHDAKLQSLHTLVEQLRQQLASENAAFSKERQQLEAHLRAARESAAGAASSAELARLQEENQRLEALLAQAEEAARQGPAEGSQEMDDLRRRFEMAVQDVRELKTKNAELTEQLAKARQAGGEPAQQGHDWESLKQRMLAQLESDFDENDDGQRADKLTVQGAIKITDQVVAEKEHEVRELRRLLESQAQQVGEVAVGAQAVAQLLDSDELIRQERDTLRQMQENLREQLRKAEVDISLERAKLARERAELDEKIRSWEAERAQMGTFDPADKGKKPGGRKWLTRLGLGENKEE